VNGAASTVDDPEDLAAVEAQGIGDELDSHGVAFRGCMRIMHPPVPALKREIGTQCMRCGNA
jgi:hypothetical protein